VLWECHRRVPNDHHAIDLLLAYGLRHTLPTWIYHRGFSTCSLNTQETIPEEITPVVIKAASMAFPKRMASGDKELCLHRLLFLQYQSRLQTFREIIGDGEFRASEFLRFRSCDLLTAAKEYMRDENFSAVEVLLAHHLDVLVPHLLEILSQCPETTPPSHYEQLLPPFLSLKEKQTVRSREPDWVEDEAILGLLGIRSKNAQRQIYSMLHASFAPSGGANQLDFRNSEDVYHNSSGQDLVTPSEVEADDASVEQSFLELSSDRVRHWYQERAKEIDLVSGQLENAQILIECGIRRGVQGLEGIHSDLVTLSSLVYDEEADGHHEKQQSSSKKVETQGSASDICISFLHFHKLNGDEKLHLLLAGSTNETLIRNIRVRALPFLERVREHHSEEEDAGEVDVLLLRRWMVNMARGDRFHWCSLIIQASRPAKDNPEDCRIIKSREQLMRTALEVIYSCPETTPSVLRQMNVIFESLPERSPEASSEELELQDQVDLLERHLNANDILLKYALAQPMHFFLKQHAATNGEEDNPPKHILLQRMAQHVARSAAESSQVWIDLLKDMLALRNQVLNDVEDEFCYSLF